MIVTQSHDKGHAGALAIVVHMLNQDSELTPDTLELAVVVEPLLSEISMVELGINNAQARRPHAHFLHKANMDTRKVQVMPLAQGKTM